MYRCDRCGESSEKGETCNKYVAKTREKIYHYCIIETRDFGGSKAEIIAKPANEITLLQGQKIARQWQTKGSEIVKELKLCAECLAEVEAVTSKSELNT
jgi:hypothetical protein